MASMTVFDPTPSLPAYITEPPTAQFTPGPGCVDPENHWVVVTSCFAQELGVSTYTSPDWLTCQLTQFGPPEYRPSSCYQPYSAQTVIDGETRYYSGCPSGYTGASTGGYARSDGLSSYVYVTCCPTQYNFNLDDVASGYYTFITESDGVSASAGYPLPACVASYITELSGSEIPVQTTYNTYGWEKRQLANVPWDYLRDTMCISDAESQGYSYNVFMSTHTCYQDCQGWHEYYFSGGPMPSFSIPPTTTEDEPITTTSVEEPTTTDTTSESEVDTPPEETSVTDQSSTDENSETSTSTSSAETTTSSNEEGITSSPEPTPTPTPNASNGNVISSSSTIAGVPESGSAAILVSARLILLGFFTLLTVL